MDDGWRSVGEPLGSGNATQDAHAGPASTMVSDRILTELPSGRPSLSRRRRSAAGTSAGARLGPRLVHTPSEPSGSQRSPTVHRCAGRRCDPGETGPVQTLIRMGSCLAQPTIRDKQHGSTVQATPSAARRRPPAATSSRGSPLGAPVSPGGPKPVGAPSRVTAESDRTSPTPRPPNVVPFPLRPVWCCLFTLSGGGWLLRRGLRGAASSGPGPCRDPGSCFFSAEGSPGSVGEILCDPCASSHLRCLR